MKREVSATRGYPSFMDHLLLRLTVKASPVKTLTMYIPVNYHGYPTTSGEEVRP